MNTIICTHTELDDEDRCMECREYVQTYSECTSCEWFGIPIIDDGAPDTCNRCILKMIRAIQDSGVDVENSSVAMEILDQLDEDYKYFIDRMKFLDDKDKRLNSEDGVK